MYYEKITEKHNLKSKDIDQKSVLEIVEIINNEDKLVAEAVEKSLDSITCFIKVVIDKIKNGGKLFYLGSGTSGRLGVLDASECPPTFSVESSMVQGIIAGGQSALVKSIEGAEDEVDGGKKAILDNKINNKDIVLGISASGNTPFVLGGLEKAQEIGATTGLLSCNKVKKNHYINYSISILVGPEIIAGSTRMKAGTATKMVLNMISTTMMIRINKTYDNLMVDLKASNSKLWNRACYILELVIGLNKQDALKLLKKADGEVKTAILMSKLEIDKINARDILKENAGSLRSSFKVKNDKDYYK